MWIHDDLETQEEEKLIVHRSNGDAIYLSTECLAGECEDCTDEGCDCSCH
jgi:hypothetical protein